MTDADAEMLRCLGFAFEMEGVSSWPVWLCPMDTVHEAVKRGWLDDSEKLPLIPRWGMATVNYKLTPAGHGEFLRLLWVRSGNAITPVSVTP